MSHVNFCSPCVMPYSRSGHVIFCLYCKYSSNTETKVQIAKFKGDSITSNFKIPTFKRIVKSSIVVSLDSAKLDHFRGYDLKRISGCLYLKFDTAPGVDVEVRMEWQDAATEAV